MAYTKQVWKDLPNETTPLSAERLNHMETQYEEAVKLVSSLPVSVLDFGAVGDGEANDSPAIQEALNSASGVVIFPPGVYGVDSDIVIPHGVTLSGYGAIIRRRSSSSYFKVFLNGVRGSQTATEYNGNGDITVEGLEIDLNSFKAPIKNADGTVNTGATMTAFDLGHGSNITLRDVTIRNGQNGHYLQVAGCQDVTFDRCRFLDMNWLNTSNRNYEAVQIEPITQVSFPSFGVWDGTVSRNVRFEGCLFEKVVRGVGTHSSVPGSRCTQIVISNSTFRDIYDSGVALTGYKGVTVSNCTLESIGYAGVIVMDSEDVDLVGVQVLRSGAPGLQVTRGSRVSAVNCCLTDTGALKEESGSSYSAVRVFDSSFVSVINSPIRGSFHRYAFAETGSESSSLDATLVTPGDGPANMGVVSSDNYTSFRLVGKDFDLFSGDASELGVAATLSMDIRLFKGALVGVNGNSSPSASMVTQLVSNIQRPSTTAVGRYRVALSAGASAEYSFPSSTQIRPDTVTANNTPHIRSVIGVSY